MELRIFTEPQQGATYDDLVAVAREAERLGFGAFFRSDHYLRIGQGDPGPGSTDAWTTLAGLARDTTTIRLGTLVTSATFRRPGPLAVTVATVDQMSGGRVELGLGAGWYEAEHAAYAIPFPNTGDRFDDLEGQLALIKGMWAPEGPTLPKPVQSRLPVIVGGRGPRRTPALAATYADEFNLPFVPLAEGLPIIEKVKRACDDIGRDPDSLRYSSALVLCVGADEAEFQRRAAAIGHDPGVLRATQLGGTVSEVVERIGQYVDAGQTRLYLQTLDLADLDHIGLVAQEIVPRIAAAIT